MIILPIQIPGYYLTLFLLEKAGYLLGYDPVLFSIIIGGFAALFFIFFYPSHRPYKDKSLFSIFLVIFFASSLFGRDDDWRYIKSIQNHSQEYPVYKISREIIDGGIRGDFIEKPTLPNVIGNLIINLTPMAVYADARDLVANFSKSFQTNFHENKTALALSAVGFVPLLGDTKNIKRAFELGQQARRESKILREIGDLSLVRKTLPEIPHYIRESFEGEIRLRTFKKGEILYRSPRSEEMALMPGRFFGTRMPVTSKGTDSLYHSSVHGNPNEIIRSYEFKQNVTVYYGKVKDGNGYQVYIPKDILPEEVLKWAGVRTLK